MKRLQKTLVLVLLALLSATLAFATGGGEKPAKITFASWNGKGEDKQFLDAFMKQNPSITVENEVIDGNNWDRLIKVRLLSGDPPDAFFLFATQLPKFAKEGYLLDISAEYAGKAVASIPTLKQISSGADGKIYALPMSVRGGPLPVYYNKKLFAKLGITTLPATWSDFYKLCDKIKAAGIDPLVFGLKDPWTMEYFFRNRSFTGLLDKYPDWQFALYNGDVKASVLLRQEFVLARQMLDKGYFSKDNLTLTYPQSLPYFVEGKAAMLACGPWIPTVDEVKASDPSKFELGAFITPIDPVNGKKLAFAEVPYFTSAAKAGKNIAAAKKLLNFFATPDTQIAFNGFWGTVNLFDLQYKVDPVLQSYYDSLKSWTMLPLAKAVLPSAFIYDAMWKGFQNIVSGSPVDTELATLDDQFAKLRDTAVQTQ